MTLHQQALTPVPLPLHPQAKPVSTVHPNVPHQGCKRVPASKLHLQGQSGVTQTERTFSGSGFNVKIEGRLYFKQNQAPLRFEGSSALDREPPGRREGSRGGWQLSPLSFAFSLGFSHLDTCWHQESASRIQAVPLLQEEQGLSGVKQTLD